MKTYLQLNKQEILSEIQSYIKSELSYTPENITEIGETNRFSLAYNVDSKYVVKIVTPTHKRMHNMFAEFKNIMFAPYMDNPWFDTFISTTEMVTHEYAITKKLYSLGYSPEPVHASQNTTLNSGIYVTKYIDFTEVAMFSLDQDMYPLISELFAMINTLHENNIAHGDLQPDNVLVYKNSVSLIDPANINIHSNYKVFDIASALSVAYIIGSPELCLSTAREHFSEEELEDSTELLRLVGMQLGYKKRIIPLYTHLTQHL